MENLPRSVLFMVALLSVSLAWGEGENSPCAKLLPKEDLKGWKEISGSYLYGKGDGLASIYNGGYPLYLENGVQEASQKLYWRDNLVATVTTHTMKDASAARKFVEYWRNAHRKQKPQPLKIAGTGFWIQADGATTFYWTKGRFFVTVMVVRDDRQAVEAGLQVLRTIASRVK